MQTMRNNQSIIERVAEVRDVLRGGEGWIDDVLIDVISELKLLRQFAKVGERALRNKISAQKSK